MLHKGLHHQRNDTIERTTNKSLISQAEKSARVLNDLFVTRRKALATATVAHVESYVKRLPGAKALTTAATYLLSIGSDTQINITEGSTTNPLSNAVFLRVTESNKGLDYKQY